MLGMEGGQPAYTGLPFGLIHRASPPCVSRRIQILQDEQDLVPIGFCPEALRHPSQARLGTLSLPLIPVGFHLVGLEFPLMRQVRVPTTWVTTFTWLDVFDDHAGCLGVLQAYSIDAPIPAPKALHPAQILQSLGLGHFQNKPTGFVLLHHFFFLRGCLGGPPAGRLFFDRSSLWADK